MFQLYELTREVRIAPHHLGHDRVEAVVDELNVKLANRVVLGVGLVMALWDVVEVGQGVIYPGDGGVHCAVKFRAIVFRPFQDEIIVGKIKRCTPEGVYVTIGFFDDIFIPQEGLPHPSKFDEREQIWIWEYKNEEEDEIHEMYMDKGEALRFRITGEGFTDTTPIPSSCGIMEGGAQGAGPSSTTEPVIEENKDPYTLTASINEPGLGLISWWS